MATDKFRVNMIELYRESRAPDLFLSQFFDVRPGNISSSEKVTIDVVREDEEISPVVNICEGGSWNESTLFTNKEWTPPSIMEKMPFDCSSLLLREPGVDPFSMDGVSFQAQLLSKIVDGLSRLSGKIARNREHQAAQILQTGILNLEGVDGTTFYNVDFKPKATHFANVATVWSNTAANILADLESLAEVIRTDSLMNPDILIMGDDAYNNFIRNAEVQALFDNRRMDVGEIVPFNRSTNGATRKGRVDVASYTFEIWTYSGRGIIPGAGTKTNYVDTNFVIMMSSDGRLDTVFGGVPRPLAIDARFQGLGLPPRISIPGAIDISPNVYATPDGMSTIMSVTSRPLLIPTAIDTFGRLDTATV